MTARPDQQDSQKGLFPTSAVRGHPTLPAEGLRLREGILLIGGHRTAGTMMASLKRPREANHWSR